MNNPNPIQINEILGCSVEKLEQLGVFNASVNLDNPYYIHPNLLKFTTIEPLKQTYSDVIGHLRQILDVLQHDGIEIAKTLFKFKEKKFEYIGHGEGQPFGKNNGRGVSGKLSIQTLQKMDKFIKKNPLLLRGDIFRIFPLFGMGFGCNRISDIIFSLGFDDFCAYSENIYKELNVPTSAFTTNIKQYNFFRYREIPLMLYPIEVLAPIDDSKEVYKLHRTNQEIRDIINTALGKSKATVSNIRAVANTQENEILKYASTLLDALDKTPTSALPIDHTITEKIRYQAKQLSQSYPKISSSLKDAFLAVCQKFQHAIEHKGINKLLYYDTGRVLSEPKIRDLFYLSLLSWEDEKVLRIRESDTGRGHTDLLLRSQQGESIIFELKLSTHKEIIHGYKSQLPNYMESENITNGVFMIIQVGKDKSNIDKFKKWYSDKNNQNSDIQLIIIDGTIQPPASKKLS